jgi:hypothetical protein
MSVPLASDFKIFQCAIRHDPDSVIVNILVVEP